MFLSLYQDGKEKVLLCVHYWDHIQSFCSFVMRRSMVNYALGGGEVTYFV